MSSISNRIKAMANERDVPYQSLIKMILAERWKKRWRSIKLKIESKFQELNNLQNFVCELM